MLIADKGYDANALREAVRERDAWANIPPKANRRDPICFSKHLYKARNLVERFFNRIKQFRRIATRYDKLAENFLAAVKLAAVRVWLGVFACYVAERGHAFVDRELYLPKSWTDDKARMAKAHVPRELIDSAHDGFATKPALALAMIERAIGANVPFSSSPPILSTASAISKWRSGAPAKAMCSA